HSSAWFAHTLSAATHERPLKLLIKLRSPLVAECGTAHTYRSRVLKRAKPNCIRVGHHLDVGIVGCIPRDWLELDPANNRIARVGCRAFPLQRNSPLRRKHKVIPPPS